MVLAQPRFPTIGSAPMEDKGVYTADSVPARSTGRNGGHWSATTAEHLEARRVIRKRGRARIDTHLSRLAPTDTKEDNSAFTKLTFAEF
jgi:hypothetical protein